MSLADVYTNKYASGGSTGNGEGEKTAEEKKVEEMLAKFSEQDCAKLGAASDLLDAFGIEAEDGPTKIAQAANIVDHFTKEVVEDGEGEKDEAPAEDAEKLAAEYEAAGRIMARGFDDETKKLAGQNAGSETPSFSDRVAAALK